MGLKVIKQSKFVLLVTGFYLLLPVDIHGQSGSSKTASGSVCISTVPKTNSEPVSLGNPDGGNRSFNYTIQIGSQKVTASTEHSISIKNLSLSKVHLVKIMRDGKMVESFRFKFSKVGGPDLCLWYKSLYE
ncbi:MAG TPA: hypothetical protein VEF04_16390, partial [Blastocatellia bacterium]|nr:hypothetical protein [Blastocatellia bacterium]